MTLASLTALSKTLPHPGILYHTLPTSTSCSIPTEDVLSLPFTLTYLNLSHFCLLPHPPPITVARPLVLHRAFRCRDLCSTCVISSTKQVVYQQTSGTQRPPYQLLPADTLTTSTRSSIRHWFGCLLDLGHSSSCTNLHTLSRFWH